MKRKPAAVLTINRPGRMTELERARISDWLRAQALLLREEGNDLTDGRYRARYFPTYKLTRRRG